VSARAGGLPLAAVTLALGVSAACGSSPTSPGPVTPPVTVVNTPPVVESIVASASRAEVETDVTLTATVRDAETPVAQLRFEWRADAGTFAGEGASVTWRAPKGTTTPADYTIRLTVTETYGSANNAVSGSQQNIVNATSPAIRLHDSPKELADLGLTFLGDFANSSVPPSACVREFSDSCRGKADEKADIEYNREHFSIVGSSLRLQNVRVAPSGVTADVNVECSFTSRVIKCEPGSVGCTVGVVGTAAGDCALTAVYEQQRWWLCTSRFLNGVAVPVAFRSFFTRQPD
jgi:hypothetical protein